jgi:hypothetical protein
MGDNMALEGTLNTPIGKVPKKGAVIVGVGGAAVLGIVWYRSKQQASQAATSSTSSTDSSNIDPATGYPYGSAEDVAAEQQLQGQSGALGPLYDPQYYGGYGGGGYGGGFPGPQGPGTFTSNAAWSQAAEDYLVNTIGESAPDVGNALGKYITAQPVTPDQEAFINQAIAFAGYPPVPGPDGFPPSMKNAPGPPPPPKKGNAQNPVKGLTVHARFTQADVSWKPSKGATSYRIRVRDTHNHIVVEQSISGTGTTVHNLPRQARLEMNVLAEPAASGAKVAKTWFHTGE